jgi:hypothetical protein
MEVVLNFLKGVQIHFPLKMPLQIPPKFPAKYAPASITQQ